MPGAGYTAVVTPTVLLHPLPGEKRALVVARLVERLHRDGRRLVVWVADAARRRVLDDFLWTFDQVSFVPHAAWAGGEGEVEDPVVLLGEAANPNRADVLVVGDELPPAAWATAFAEVHDFAPAGADGDQRRACWQAAGFEAVETAD